MGDFLLRARGVMSSANPTPEFLVDASESIKALFADHGFTILAACIIVPTVLSYILPHLQSIGGLFTSNRVDPRLAEKMVQRRMELEAKFIADAEKEKQARKLKQIEKENRQQEEREQGKAMFENSSSTKGRKLGGAVPAFPSECCLTLRCGCSQEETKVPSDGPICVCCLLIVVLGRTFKLQTEWHPKAWRRMRLRIGHLT